MLGNRWSADGELIGQLLHRRGLFAHQVEDFPSGRVGSRLEDHVVSCHLPQA
jgi:hypothetical protein